MSGAAHSATPRLQQPVSPALPQGEPSNLALARELLDNRALFLGVARGHSPGDVRVTVGGDAAAPSLAVTDVDPVPVRDEDLVWRAANPSAGTVLPGALAASTIHYLYLRSATDGTISYVVSTTAPTTGSYRATGDELQRHVATFATGLLGFPLPAVVRQGSGRYIASSGRGELVVLDNGQAVTWAAVSLAALVPPSATTAWVMARVYRAAADAGGIEVQVRRSSADSGYLTAARANASGGGVGETIDTLDEKLVAIPLTAQAFEYQLNAAVTAGAPYGARFIVVGWE